MLFRTTQRFLEHFGLERPGQLPALPDDIDLPPGEISAQLGLDEAAVVEALKPRDEPEPDAADVPADDATGDLAATEGSMEAVLSEAGALPDIEIPEDVQALSEAAEQAFEASRERLSGGE
jgi:hypothetical protein